MAFSFWIALKLVSPPAGIPLSYFYNQFLSWSIWIDEVVTQTNWNFYFLTKSKIHSMALIWKELEPAEGLKAERNEFLGV